MPVALAPTLTREETWQCMWLCVMWWQPVSVYQLNKRPEAGSLLLPLHYREHIWNDVTLSHVAFSGRCLLPDLASWENVLWIHKPLVAWRISRFNPEGETLHIHFHAYSAPFNSCVMCAFLNITLTLYTDFLQGNTCIVCSNCVCVCFAFFSVWTEVAVPHPVFVTPWLHDPVTCLAQILKWVNMQKDTWYYWLFPLSLCVCVCVVAGSIGVGFRFQAYDKYYLSIHCKK